MIIAQDDRVEPGRKEDSRPACYDHRKGCRPCLANPLNVEALQSFTSSELNPGHLLYEVKSFCASHPSVTIVDSITPRLGQAELLSLLQVINCGCVGNST